MVHCRRCWKGACHERVALAYPGWPRGGSGQRAGRNRRCVHRSRAHCGAVERRGGSGDRSGGPRGLPRPDRHACAPARAGAGMEGRHRLRLPRGGGGRCDDHVLHAEHRPAYRPCRRGAADRGSLGAGGPVPRAPDRRGDEESRRPRADRDARSGARRLRGLLRRRHADLACGRDAPGAGICVQLRVSGHPACRGKGADRGRRDQRGLGFDPAGRARHAGGGRGCDGGAGYHAHPPGRRPLPCGAYLLQGRGGPGAGRARRRTEGERRGRAASFRADRGGCAGLQCRRQNEPAAAHRGRPSGGDRRPARRHDRGDRHRSRAAP